MDLHAALTAPNAAGNEFLKTELSLANTFLDIAETTTMPVDRLKSHEDTKKAYRGVLHLWPRLQLSPQQKLDFEQLTLELKNRMLLPVLKTNKK